MEVWDRERESLCDWFLNCFHDFCVDFCDGHLGEFAGVDAGLVECWQSFQGFGEANVAVGFDLFDAVDGGEVRRRVECLWVLFDQLEDGFDGFGETVEFTLRVALGGLDHEAERLWPSDRGGVEAEVEEELAYARCGIGLAQADAFERGEVLSLQGEDKLVHAWFRVGAVGQGRVVVA